LVESLGYEVSVVLNEACTKDGMIGILTDLVDRTGFGDHSLAFYSGHGTWVPDTSGDEADGRDEALVPYDYRTAGMLTDDHMFDISARKRYGARIVMLFDSCLPDRQQEAQVHATCRRADRRSEGRSLRGGTPAHPWPVAPLSAPPGRVCPC